MTNRELLAEVRRFFPHAKMNIGRYCVPMFTMLRSGLFVWADANDLWSAQIVRRGKRDSFRRAARNASSPAEALRALGFAERVSELGSLKRAVWEHRKREPKSDGSIVTACQLRSTQRPRKGVRLGRRKRREASR